MRECGREVEKVIERAESLQKGDWRCVMECSSLVDQLLQVHSFPVRCQVGTSIGLRSVTSPGSSRDQYWSEVLSRIK